MKDSSGLHVGVMEATSKYTGTVPEWCFKTVGVWGRAPEANNFELKTPSNVRKNCTKNRSRLHGAQPTYVQSADKWGGVMALGSKGVGVIRRWEGGVLALGRKGVT